MMKHLSIRVSGRVQGVFFRASAVKKAQSLGLAGIVKNERDGSVYIEAEGEEEPLKEFVHWCQLGPPAAVVNTCEINEGSLRHYNSFDILR